MYIEGDFIIDGEINRMHKLIYDYLFENKLKITYTIEFFIKVIDGNIIQNIFEINFIND
jgi:hypothetical protein